MRQLELAIDVNYRQIVTWSDRDFCIEKLYKNLFESEKAILEDIFISLKMSVFLHYVTIYDWVLTHWDRDTIDAILQTPYSNAFSWMKIYELLQKFHWNLLPRVQLTIFQHWFR